ncbi:MAG TPA: tetratricopeptide repeat protein, partial [Blastocatellia bacterium]|nr:tetratricopeptide repeat protein [Blastocatellia bacterium]
MNDIFQPPAYNDTPLNQPPTDGRIQTPQMGAQQLTQIGANAAKNGLVDVARVAFTRAVREERRGDTLANLANALRQLWRFDEANKIIDEALQFAPQDGRVWGIKGVTMLDQNRSADAIAAFQNSLMWGGAAPFTKFGLAEAQLHAGDFDRGLRGYESRFEINQPRLHSIPRWQGEPLGERVLLVEAEQGFGDSFMFSRFLSRIPGDYTFSVQSQAMSLFGVNAKRLGEAVRADYWSPLMSLPLIVGTDISEARVFRPNRIL